MNANEYLKSKIKNCHNTNTIFDTRDYVLLSDVELMLKHIAIELTSNISFNPDEIVKSCSTCKHPYNKYVEPCYGCRDNDEYDNWESE